MRRFPGVGTSWTLSERVCIAVTFELTSPERAVLWVKFLRAS